MDVETAVRTRRTHKAYGPEPVDEATLRQLVELATWAPNHHLTNPWRFRVVGPEALAKLKTAADAIEPGSGAKLDRAPTLIAVTTVVTHDPQQSEEDLCASAVAAYLLLLGAHARGLAGYWRTPAVLRDDAGRDALQLGEDEHPVALVYLGHPRQEQRVPERTPAGEVLHWLD